MGQCVPHPTIQRAFSAGGSQHAFTSWTSTAKPPDADIHAALRQLRARSRDAAQNDDHMSFFLRLVESNVIGRQGIVAQSKPTLKSGNYDKASAARIEALFAAQSERGNWDVTGQFDRTAFDRLAVRTVAMDGEVLIRIHEHIPDAPTGFAVELIDPEALDVSYDANLSNGNMVRMGVEMTPRRRPVAYHLFVMPHPYAGSYAGYNSAERVRIPASDLLHVFLPEWVWGTRGVPWAKTALRRLKMLTGYEEAAITAARTAATKSSAYVANEFAAGLPQNRIADGDFVQEIEANQVEIVPFGYDLKTLDWAWPNTRHGEFIKAALRGISCGLGITYNMLGNDLEGVNFSSLRQGALQERDLWMLIQDWYINWVTKPIYLRWLQHVLYFGQLRKRNGDQYPLDQFNLLSPAVFQARRWPWVDPLKDIQANKEAIALGIRSVSDVIREGGRDPEDVWDELADDLKQLQQRGIPNPLAVPPPMNLPQQQVIPDE